MKYLTKLILNTIKIILYRNNSKRLIGKEVNVILSVFMHRCKFKQCNRAPRKINFTRKFAEIERKLQVMDR
jgi:hypothetical protein